MDRLSALPWAQEQSSLGIFISRALRYGDAQSLCAASRTIKARGARHGDADATLTRLCAQVHVLTSVEAECRARWCVEGEQAVLAHIARSQNGWGRLQRWGEVRAPVGTWEGVTTNAQGRVTEIELNDKNLRGARGVLNRSATNKVTMMCDRAGPSLDETLRLLAPLAPKLAYLILGGNELGGTITAGIAAFTKLTLLDLCEMDLEGECICVSCVSPVPTRSGAGSNQKKRNKTHTRNVPGAFLRTGAIPESVGGLSSLQTLDLGFNGLSGMSV